MTDVAAGTRAEGGSIEFSAELVSIEESTLLRLPAEASKALPSRGQVAVRCEINGKSFDTVLEPDGRRGHWIPVDGTLQKATGLSAGDTAKVSLEVREDWPEPRVPEDLAAALAEAPAKIQDIWEDITPMARWEWVRWVKATKNPDTRERRVEVSISKMSNGKRRPCCFDLSSCTDPELSRSGKLIEAP